MKKRLILGNNGKKEEYLAKLFSILKKSDYITFVDKKTNFNHTEIRLLSEILWAQYEGERLISTQLAQRLGITRSAVSQIVNRLELQGVVNRVPDEVDRKIAYIEISDETLDTYGEDMEKCLCFVGRVVEEFGEDNFNEMHRLFVSFIDLAQEMICVKTEK